jgi:ferredoxin
MADESTPKIARIEIDRDTCISAGSCVAIAPQTFQLDEEGKVKLVDPKGNDDATIIEAAKSCPVNAITLTDEAGKKIWPV